MQTVFVRPFLALKWIFIVLALSVSFCVQAQQNWPSRPIHLIVPYAAGGTTDVISRLLGTKLSESLGQPVIVDNRTGASGNIGGAFFATSPPDDHLFMVVTMPMMSVNQYLFRKTGFNPITDLKPIGLIGGTPNVIVASPAMKVHTLKELAEYGKAHPSKLSYSSSSIGSTGHLEIELFKADVGNAQLAEHVPYRGDAPAIMALVAGDVQFMNANVSLLLPQIRAGKLQPLAVTSAKRLPQLPEVPTVSEAGFPNMTLSGWWGLVAQSKTQPEVIARMNRELLAILKNPGFIAEMREYSIEVLPGTPEDMTVAASKERVRWKKIIDISGAKAEE